MPVCRFANANAAPVIALKTLANRAGAWGRSFQIHSGPRATKPLPVLALTDAHPAAAAVCHIFDVSLIVFWLFLF